jgi:glycosyltransferase involved in cell wall biosynthesis
VLHGNVWAHYLALGALRQAHPGRYRTIWHTHNFLNVDRHLGLRGRFNCWQIRRGADWLLCVSHAVAAGWGRSGVRTRVVHNCVSSRHEALGPVGARPRPADGRPLRLVGAGRLEWCKGHHVSIEAVARLRAAGWPVTLDLFGGPLAGNPYHDRLRRRVAELGLGSAVAFRGYADDVVQRLEGYDVALQSRIDPEPCSLYVLECMQRALPLVASAGGGTRELLRDGHEGILYPPGDVEALARGVEWLARDPAAATRCAHAARERVRREFSPGRFARDLQAFYAEVLGSLPARLTRVPGPPADAAPPGEETG